jgi:hypothetical protein
MQGLYNIVITLIAIIKNATLSVFDADKSEGDASLCEAWVTILND